MEDYFLPLYFKYFTRDNIKGTNLLNRLNKYKVYKKNIYKNKNKNNANALTTIEKYFSEEVKFFINGAIK